MLLRLPSVAFAVIRPPSRLLVLLAAGMRIAALGVVNCSAVIDGDAASWALPSEVLNGHGPLLRPRN